MDIFIFIPILLGLLGGYLVNYLSDVLPATRRFSRPACPNCQRSYSWGDFLLLRHCQGCGGARGIRTHIVMGVFLAGAIYLWVRPPQRLGFYLAFLLLVYLGVVFVIDLEHRLIMHPVSITGAFLGLGIGTYVHGLVPALLGGAIGFGVMLAFFFLGGVFAKFMSKRRGQEIDEVALGFGDVNLAGIAGLLLGSPVVIAGLFFTIFAGGLASILVILVMLIRKQYEAFTPIPYAPFLILSILFYLYR